MKVRILISRGILLLLVIGAVNVFAQEGGPISLAKKIGTTTPDIDGKLNEEIWKNAKWTSNFRTPKNGEPENQTEFSIVYNNYNLYVAMKLHESDPSKIVKKNGKRDDTEGDRIALFFDTNHDKKSTYVFVINAAGVIRDQISEVVDGKLTWNNKWTAEWDHALEITDTGWNIEFKIPLDQMDFDNLEEHSWGIQLTRVSGDKTSFWSPFNPKRGWIGSFGTLNGIKGVRGLRSRKN